MKVTLITRIKSINKQDDIDDFKSWFDVFLKNEQITQIYIISDQLSKDNLKLNHNKVEFIIPGMDPTSPTSINLAIERLSEDKVDAFIVASQEVKINENNIKKLILEIENNKNPLVVGYKFEIKDKKLKNELQNYYKNKDLIAYRVPWNTCAIWNYELFYNYVKKFDEITDKNLFSPLCVCVDNICRQVDHKGMEDGLAIAKASSQNDSKIHFKLLNKKPLLWEIKKNYNKIQRHREKLARKDTVLRNFMAVRDYSVENLLKAEKKDKEK